MTQTIITLACVTSACDSERSWFGESVLYRAKVGRWVKFVCIQGGSNLVAPLEKIATIILPCNNS